jgi:hypothetical protein
VREKALFEIQPNALDWVQLGRVRRQRHQSNVGRYGKRARAVPSGLVEHHHGMLIRADRCREAIKELLHRFSVHIRHDESEAVIGAGFDGCKNIGEREAFVGKAGRALAARPPDVAGPALLSDARFVLEEQPDALIFVRTLNAPQ